jgi:integrase/recombinase XerD
VRVKIMESNVIRLSNSNSPVTSLSAAIKSFILHCNSRNLSQCTIDYYNYSFLAFTKFTDLPPIEITTDTIRAFLVEQSKHVNETTLQHRHCALNVFFKFLAEEGYLQCNPVARIPKPKRKKSVINTFSIDDMERILKVCKNDFVGVRGDGNYINRC